MLVYVDDSGDGGFKFGAGSSCIAVFAAVIFDDPRELQKLAREIENIKKRFNYQGELKFSKNSDQARLHLLTAISNSGCRIMCLYADKRYIYTQKLKDEPRALKAYLLRMLLSQHDGKLHDAKVFIDGKDTKGFSTEKSDQSYFKRMCNRLYPNTATDIRFVDSKENIGIQIADLVAGSVFAFQERGDRRFFDVIGHKTRQSASGNLWNFTRQEELADIVRGTYILPSQI